MNNYANNSALKSNVLSPKEGLTLGNLYANEYDQYKNYRPVQLRATNEQERELLKIRELAFAVNDLSLSLDVDPKNGELFRLFKMYATELTERVKRYSEKYEPLEVCYDLGSEYSWYKNPWPWEVDKYV